jgi:hypothetical protein
MDRYAGGETAELRIEGDEPDHAHASAEGVAARLGRLERA